MGSSQELYVLICSCKVEQPDAMQHNGLADSETEMCMWKYGAVRILEYMVAASLEDGRHTTLRARS